MLDLDGGREKRWEFSRDWQASNISARRKISGANRQGRQREAAGQGESPSVI